MQTLEDLSGQTIDVIHIVGGGSRNRLLNQLTADVTGRRVVAGPTEATAAGNALVQASYLINRPIMKKHRMAGVSLRQERAWC